MAKTKLASRNLGGPKTPQEVKQLRQQSFEMEQQLGFPVIHKHRWNLQDLNEGLVQRCPLHDDLYAGDATFDNVCFGTGFVGGYGDPTIVYVTLQDTSTDTIRISSTGALIMDQHPQMTAPWLPEMGDGDLIILADFVPGTWKINVTYERYVLEQVEPITMRGPNFSYSPETTRNRFRISQQSKVDKLPWGHRLYDVPIEFDPSIVPVDPTPDDPGVDPNYFGTYSESDSYATRVNGTTAPLTSTHTQDVAVAVEDAFNTSDTRRVSVKGIGSGTVVHID
jgi:hypothetical protein